LQLGRHFPRFDNGGKVDGFLLRERCPVMRTFPPGIGSSMRGADMTLSSSTIANCLPVFLAVVS
jgi:hypothetical protein